EKRRERRNGATRGAGYGADDGGGSGSRGEGERAEPTADAEAFDRNRLNGPAEHHGGKERQRRYFRPQIRGKALYAPGSKGAGKGKGRKRDAGGRLPRPLRMLGNRAAEAEFEPVRRAVENAPVATDRPFERTLPGLIERLDDIDLEVLALGESQRFADDARLVPGRRPRAL